MSQSIDTINQIIRSRRSIFPPDYIDKEVPRDVIETILENANYAPTHRLTQPWRFTIFRGDGLTKLADFMSDTYRSNATPESFSEAKYEGTRNKVLKSSCILAIVMEVHPDKVPEWEEVAAVSCAVENMWLTATALGVGAYWSSPSNLAALEAFLNLTPTQKCLGFFYMGYHQAKDKPAVRKPIAEKLTWIES
ncbi:nitroreductase [Spirosoma sp. RP8]|uniref:Putative NAD(P)H nitroreductase n=1 Tax=Spirosoma liriopis TaxID=2937440 RepID=A0ABT0HSH6_9BACT|nr:nitroreductase [Spirosoma liriopis]MCK8495126.1 nitroreductase [Spirosoma liriopis]